VRGVERVVEEDRYCIDVLTQIGAVQAALDRSRSAYRSLPRSFTAGRRAPTGGCPEAGARRCLGGNRGHRRAGATIGFRPIYPTVYTATAAGAL
jgi:Metal-sensitive transcriptional repressor